MLTAKRETFQAELDALLATGCNDPAAGSNVTFLHSDHLGRPKFATNADGDIVWDEGITTPFGIQITAMAAQTQALMFPGQYEDLETTGAGVRLSHNWHRTYDPMLGRYLQSDPIGLAGGLNRYAYVGGNPVSRVDPTGEIVPLLLIGGHVLFSAAVDIYIQTKVQGKSLRCVNLVSTGVSAALGAVPGASYIKPFTNARTFIQAKRAEKAINRVVPKFKSPTAKNAIDEGLLALNLSAYAFSASLEIPKLLPEFTVGNECECKTE